MWTILASEDGEFRPSVRPYSPYRNGPDPNPANAVATLTIPLKFKDIKRPFVRPDEQIITLRIKAR